MVEAELIVPILTQKSNPKLKLPHATSVLVVIDGGLQNPPVQAMRGGNLNAMMK